MTFHQTSRHKSSIPRAPAASAFREKCSFTSSRAMRKLFWIRLETPQKHGVMCTNTVFLRAFPNSRLHNRVTQYAITKSFRIALYLEPMLILVPFTRHKSVPKILFLARNGTHVKFFCCLEYCIPRSDCMNIIRFARVAGIERESSSNHISVKQE